MISIQSIKTDVLIIGGSAAGIVAAQAGKSQYPGKEFLIIRKENHVLVPCAIPYLFKTLDSTRQNIIPDEPLKNAGIKLKIAEITSINRQNKTCKTDDQTEITYDKLIMATGSTPIIPGWLKGADLENVYTIPKNKEYLDRFIQDLKNFKKITIIGAGFIGVEISDELTKAGKEVTLVEIMPDILSAAFDPEIAATAKDLLEKRGTKIKTGTGVKEILGAKKVESVLLDSTEKLQPDAVILSMGYRPNTALAKESGLKLTDAGFIETDKHMGTADPDIFASGDCAQKKNLITQKPAPIMLASTATRESTIAAMNLYGPSAENNGTIAVFSTAIGETAFGAAGLIETFAKKESIDIITGTFEGIDKHPGKLPNTSKQLVKLTASTDGTILGAQVIGSQSTGELTNLASFIIQNKTTLNTLITAQIGTHPLLTASPIAYPLLKAAQAASKKLT